MVETWPHILLLLFGIIGWIYSASPLLKNMIFLSEKDFRWPLIPWFCAITVSIFLMKFSLFILVQWPQPATWASRLFYPIWLFASPLVPFCLEILKSRKIK